MVIIKEEAAELLSGASGDNRLKDRLHRGILLKRPEVREDEDEPLLGDHPDAVLPYGFPHRVVKLHSLFSHSLNPVQEARPSPKQHISRNLSTDARGLMHQMTCFSRILCHTGREKPLRTRAPASLHQKNNPAAFQAAGLFMVCTCVSEFQFIRTRSALRAGSRPRSRCARSLRGQPSHPGGQSPVCLTQCPTRGRRCWCVP